jgi:hypothetical protein
VHRLDELPFGLNGTIAAPDTNPSKIADKPFSHSRRILNASVTRGLSHRGNGGVAPKAL